MNTKETLRRMCRLYDGGNDINKDNPFDKRQDQFLWYMWMCEFDIVNTDDPSVSVANAQRHFDDMTDAYIRKYSGHVSNPTREQLEEHYRSLPLLHPVE